MLDLLLSDGMKPFMVASTLVVGLLFLEVVMLLMGLSTQIGGDAPTIDFEADLDLSMDMDVDIDVAGQPEASGSLFGVIADAIGLKNLPLTVWLAIFSASFAASGFAMQIGLQILVGSMLPASIIAMPAVPIGLFVTKGLAAFVSRMIPSDETDVVSRRSLARRRGFVTVGVARKDHPAEVCVTDQHGNRHYHMMEPFDEADEIQEGAEVFVMRLRDGQFRIVQVSE
jgi:hypothetical protein